MTSDEIKLGDLSGEMFPQQTFLLALPEGVAQLAELNGWDSEGDGAISAETYELG